MQVTATGYTACMHDDEAALRAVVQLVSTWDRNGSMFLCRWCFQF
jgi:hypothetical protein